jgi:5-methylcytosine-specific restriction protein A
MRVYDTPTWKRLRRRQLSREPACRLCAQMGRMTAGTIVDHIRPHKGDPVLAYDERNLQVLCKQCHDTAKQKLDKTGQLIGSCADGMPLDPNHPWKI